MAATTILPIADVSGNGGEAAVVPAASAAEPAAYLRAHLAYDACNARQLAGFRAFAMLRGIRGREGALWGTEQLLRPPLDAVLDDTRAAGNAAVLQEAALGLLRAHTAEETNRVFEGQAAELAAKFSQHKEGRHAGQSGKRWLQAAASAVEAQALASGLALAQTLLPQLWLGSEPGAEARPMPPKDVIALTSIFKARWPFPGENALGHNYCAMDVGRLLYYAAAADGVVLPQPLSQKAFQKLLARQGRTVRVFLRRIGFDFKHYCALETGLVEKAKAHEPPPPWAASASGTVMWPGLFCLLCEYLQTIDEFGIDTVRRAITRRRGGGGG